MAAVVKADKVKYMSQVGNGIIQNVILGSDVESGDLLVITGVDTEDRVPVVSIAPAGALDVDGMAIEDAYQGDTTAMATEGLFGGFSGLPLRTRLYASGTVAGGLDTTAAGTSRVETWTDEIVRIHR